MPVVGFPQPNLPPPRSEFGTALGETAAAGIEAYRARKKQQRGSQAAQQFQADLDAGMPREQALMRFLGATEQVATPELLLKQEEHLEPERARVAATQALQGFGILKRPTTVTEEVPVEGPLPHDLQAREDARQRAMAAEQMARRATGTPSEAAEEVKTVTDLSTLLAQGRPTASRTRVVAPGEELPKGLPTAGYQAMATTALSKMLQPELETPHTVTTKQGIMQFNRKTGAFDIKVGEAPARGTTDEEVRSERLYRGILADVDRLAAKKTNVRFGGAAIQINTDGSMAIGAKGSQEALDYFDAIRDPLILDRLKKYPDLLQQYGDLHQPLVSAPAQFSEAEAAQRRVMPAPGRAAGDRGAAAQTFETRPDPAQYKGRTLTDTVTGQQFISDGVQWAPKGKGP